LLKIGLATASFLLLFPLIVFCGLFTYGKYMTHVAQERLDAIDVQQERAMKTGNGFGGDPGMEILDSGYRSEKFFWIDDDNLVFETQLMANTPEGIRRQYVWNTRERTIKPLIIEGAISAFYDGKFHYAQFSDTEVLRNGRKKSDRFQSTLKELGDSWVIENRENMEDVLDPPPERYELAWHEGKPWFYLDPKLRTESDIPKHRFEYMWEWGWILRKPWDGPQYLDQTYPEMGFFDIGGTIYADQEGVKVADLVDLPVNDLVHLVLVYVGFLDKYWLANRFYGGKPKQKFMGFLGRDGKFQEVELLDSWPGYSGIPLPSRKGLFWSGQDYRLVSPSPYDNGAFIRDRDGGIHKAIKGSALRSQLSSDGCRVAFFNPPRPDSRSGASLKIFNVCQSTMDGKELTNVDY
jgi:hypothetical protein